MSDNNLRISFDYKYPDEAALVVCNVYGGSYFGNPRASYTESHYWRKCG